MSSPGVQRRSRNRVVSRRNDDDKRRAFATDRCSGNAGACRPRHHAPRRSNAPPVGGPARAARRGTQGRPLTQGGTRRATDVVRRRLVAGCGAVADPSFGGWHTLQSCRLTGSRRPSTHTTPVHSGGGGSTHWGGSSSMTILRSLRFDLRRIGFQACCSFGFRNRSRSRTDCTSTSVPTTVTWRSSG